MDTQLHVTRNWSSNSSNVGLSCNFWYSMDDIYSITCGNFSFIRSIKLYIDVLENGMSFVFEDPYSIHTRH
jgi:hypothetical protein